jgi:type I restriction enzyme S subunit
LIPPTEEQNAIANLLDKKCNEIEDMIEGLRMEISYVTELRTKTIADVITGKVDVRNVVIPEYEEIKEVEIDEDIEDDIEDSIDEDSEE